MKKIFSVFVLSLALFISVPISASAVTAVSPGDEEPAVEETDSGGGGGDDDGGDGGGESDHEHHETEEPKEPEVLSYTPVVTALHSVNAMLANDGTAVYFMPQLQDFPVDLVDTCADVTTEDGKEHKFAIVYDGYFDTEVAYNLAQNDNTDTADVHRLQTSKKVYSQTDNSRALNLLGYDLLLSDEKSTIVTKGPIINMNYYPTLVGTSPLTAKTVIMDLYKAVGVYEWDIKVVYGKDESLAVNTSPIMQQIAVLTNDEVEGGIVTDEGATYVWASRTNPDQYWTRCKRDSIFDGGAHKYTKAVYIGNATSVTFSKNETQTVTMGEFCQMARAIMELYGEPVLTEKEIECMIQSYALTLPAEDLPKEEIEAIRYLAAKGIIDPQGVNWRKNVTFADIEELLLRIADEDSRLTFKYTSNPDDVMARSGYAKVPIAGADADFDDVSEITNPFDSDYYDYFIEAADGVSNFYLNKIAGANMSDQENFVSENEGSSDDRSQASSPRIAFYGDSISTFSGYTDFNIAYPYPGVLDSVDQTWWYQVANQNGWEYAGNSSSSGCKTGSGDHAGTSSSRLQALPSDAGEVVVFMGMNDYWQSTDIGAFKNQYVEMLRGIKQQCPKAGILCCTIYKTGFDGNNRLGEYNAAIRAAASAEGARVCNLESFNATASGATIEDDVHVHPTPTGMSQIASIVSSALGSAPNDSNSAQSVSESQQETTTSNSDSTTVGTIPVNPIVQDGKEYAFACDKLVVAGADNVATTPGSGYFEYLGMQLINDKYYYHLRISRTLSSVTIKYDYDPALEQMLDITEYTLPDANGGVYTVPEGGGTLVGQTFDEAVFDDIFIDADRVTNDYYNLENTQSYLSQYHWIKVAYSTVDWNNKVKGSATDAKIFEYKTQKGATVLVTAQELEEARKTTERRFQDGDGNVWWVYESTNEFQGVDYIYVICQTKMSVSDFKKALTVTQNNIEDNGAYYRAEDGTLLASYDFLKKQHLVNDMQVLKSGSGIMLGVRNGNVSLRTDIGAIIVGDTFIPSNGELLYYQEGNEYFINVKACLGWSDDYVIVNTDKAIIPLFTTVKQRPAQKITSFRGIHSFFPSSVCNVSYHKLLRNKNLSNKIVEGYCLNGTNPLGCYMVVFDPNKDSDYLFVWHRKDVKDSKGNTYNLQDNRGEFASMTGVNLGSVSNDYTLTMFKLDRTNTSNPAGIYYMSYDYTTLYASGTQNFGYVYKPPKFKTIDDAFKAYISGSEDCVVPIANVNGIDVNLNLNTCTDMEGNEQLPIGTLPMYLTSTTKDNLNKMGVIQPNATSVKPSSASYDNLDSVKLLASPVGLFQALKGLGTKPVSEWSKMNGALFFGSSQCTIKNNQLCIKNHKLEFNTGVDAVCALLSGSGSVYVINEDSSSLGMALEETLEEVGVIVTEPETLVDWSAYKFNRLVENMDSWTTIALIFVLNILPRIGMLLFFTLMLLALIKDVKFWRAFCVNHFDVYSFLTMGKQNVDTIDMKRIMWISLFCFSIFLIIMDGQLFNFIIFICKIIINITQR